VDKVELEAGGEFGGAGKPARNLTVNYKVLAKERMRIPCLDGNTRIA